MRRPDKPRWLETSLCRHSLSSTPRSHSYRHEHTALAAVLERRRRRREGGTGRPGPSLAGDAESSVRTLRQSRTSRYRSCRGGGEKRIGLAETAPQSNPAGPEGIVVDEVSPLECPELRSLSRPQDQGASRVLSADHQNLTHCALPNSATGIVHVRPVRHLHFDATYRC